MPFDVVGPFGDSDIRVRPACQSSPRR